jgi:hypothetical protein
MKPVNVETLLNHSTGISDSYYRPRESELLEEYLAVCEQHLSVSTENKFKSELEELRKTTKEDKKNQYEELLAFMHTMQQDFENYKKTHP